MRGKSEIKALSHLCESEVCLTCTRGVHVIFSTHMDVFVKQKGKCGPIVRRKGNF